MKNQIELTAEKFADIYTNPQFRNQVAHAHQQCDKHGNFVTYITCSYPTVYTVTAEQIGAAKCQLSIDTAKALESIGNKLVFVGMGCDYPERYPDDVCNHRIRTTFINSKGKTYFVEFGTGRGNDTRIDHSIDRDMQMKVEREGGYPSNSGNNFAGLERLQPTPQYTKANIIALVNKYFDCHFTQMEVDQYTLGPDDFICVSPKN